MARGGCEGENKRLIDRDTMTAAKYGVREGIDATAGASERESSASGVVVVLVVGGGISILSDADKEA